MFTLIRVLDFKRALTNVYFPIFILFHVLRLQWTYV